MGLWCVITTFRGVRGWFFDTRYGQEDAMYRSLVDDVLEDVEYFHAIHKSGVTVLPKPHGRNNNCRGSNNGSLSLDCSFTDFYVQIGENPIQAILKFRVQNVSGQDIPAPTPVSLLMSAGPVKSPGSVYFLQTYKFAQLQAATNQTRYMSRERMLKTSNMAEYGPVGGLRTMFLEIA